MARQNSRGTGFFSRLAKRVPDWLHLRILGFNPLLRVNLALLVLIPFLHAGFEHWNDWRDAVVEVKRESMSTLCVWVQQALEGLDDTDEIRRLVGVAIEPLTAANPKQPGSGLQAGNDLKLSIAPILVDAREKVRRLRLDLDPAGQTRDHYLEVSAALNSLTLAAIAVSNALDYPQLHLPPRIVFLGTSALSFVAGIAVYSWRLPEEIRDWIGSDEKNPFAEWLEERSSQDTAAGKLLEKRLAGLKAQNLAFQDDSEVLGAFIAEVTHDRFWSRLGCFITLLVAVGGSAVWASMKALAIVRIVE